MNLTDLPHNASFSRIHVYLIYSCTQRALARRIQYTKKFTDLSPASNSSTNAFGARKCGISRPIIDASLNSN